MAVEVLEAGFVRVTPDVLDWTDVLTHAANLIEEHGWVKGDSGDASRGFSLHGAIGQAAAALTDGGKDNPTARILRDTATERLRAVMPDKFANETAPDIVWNDAQRSSRPVVTLISKALSAA